VFGAVRRICAAIVFVRSIDANAGTVARDSISWRPRCGTPRQRVGAGNLGGVLEFTPAQDSDVLTESRLVKIHYHLGKISEARGSPLSCSAAVRRDDRALREEFVLSNRLKALALRNTVSRFASRIAGNFVASRSLGLSAAPFD